MSRTLLGLASALAASALLTIWAHLFLCAGLDPEGIYAADALAPFQGIVVGVFLAGTFSRGSANAKTGAWIAASLVALWFLAYAIFQARFALPAWPRLVFSRITPETLEYWALAIVVGGLAGWLSNRITHRWPVLLTMSIVLIATPTVMAVYVRTISAHQDIGAGVTVDRQPPDSEGTIVRLVTCDFTKEPDLSVDLYDADSDDDRPLDDRAASYYGQPASAVLSRVNRHLDSIDRSVRCLVNGGFFGADNDFVGFHISPLIVNGRALYPAHTLASKWKDQAASFAFYDTAPHFALLIGDGGGGGRRPRTLLAGLRKLRVDGVSVNLGPGLGGTTLRCSRTSIGWNRQGTVLYILNVREPDGEAGSIRQRDSGGKATGGWDVRQVQAFWESRQVDNALLFDGGESTQLVTPSISERSANHAAYTLGYWRDRPIRVYEPILPPAQNTPGVLNYLYVDGKR